LPLLALADTALAHAEYGATRPGAEQFETCPAGASRFHINRRKNPSANCVDLLGRITTPFSSSRDIL
jgi:hypothetical protein